MTIPLLLLMAVKRSSFYCGNIYEMIMDQSPIAVGTIQTQNKKTNNLCPTELTKKSYQA